MHRLLQRRLARLEADRNAHIANVDKAILFDL